MGVRLYSNLFGTLLPFYLVYVLKLGQSDKPQPDTNTGPTSIPFVVALIPLLIYLSSVCTSFILSKFYERFGRKMALITGGLLCVGCAIFLVFLSSTFSWPMYGIAILIGTFFCNLGVAQSMVLATGINLISEVIGTKGEQGAFVFGIYSLLDKFSAGIAIFFITNS
jgi:MFS family permease